MGEPIWIKLNEPGAVGVFFARVKRLRSAGDEDQVLSGRFFKGWAMDMAKEPGVDRLFFELSGLNRGVEAR